MRTFAAIAVSPLTTHAVLAQPTPPVHTMCESKPAKIARDIEHAQAKDQSSRVRGLEKALRENQDHCSDAQLPQEHAAKIAAQERKNASAAWTRHGKKASPARSQTVKPSWPGNALSGRELA
ncbi:DUF1090 family protein [Comamonas sp. UBA7528]|uniref:DUF1090 family protein n=1 Tax=Comamonas sp. UBA7528 TaxID=1946391 RepID=UPI0025B8E745|nr:DUF1090 family protein [Comamonas sp. UBA7528]